MDRRVDSAPSVHLKKIRGSLGPPGWIAHERGLGRQLLGLVWVGTPIEPSQGDRGGSESYFVNRISRLRWWWQSVWAATLAAFGRRSARSQKASFRWNRPGPPPNLSKIPRPTWLIPDDEIGVATGMRAALVSNERQALALVDCIGYSNGFEFTIAYRSRDEIPHQLLGMGPAPAPDRELIVRIDYPDGGRGTSGDRGTDAMTAHYEAAYVGREPPLPTGPVVMPQGGGGGGRRYQFSYWCWPLPPDGPMKVTVAWLGTGITSTTVEIDASPIRRAGLTSPRLWDG